MCEIRVLAGMVLVRALFLAVDRLLLAVSLWPRGRGLFSSFPYLDTNPIMRASPQDLIQIQWCPKGPASKQHHTGDSSLNISVWGETQHSVHSIRYASRQISKSKDFFSHLTVRHNQILLFLCLDVMYTVYSKWMETSVLAQLHSYITWETLIPPTGTHLLYYTWVGKWLLIFFFFFSFYTCYQGFPCLALILI